jgi:hypothetical protein
LIPEFALEILKFQNSEYEVHQYSSNDNGNGNDNDNDNVESKKSDAQVGRV